MMFLLPQEETEGASYKERMLISDALPVQFWPEGCDTYNESENYGIHPICWIQPFTCDDEISIQFQDNEIGINSTSVSLPALTAWATRSTSPSLVDWTTGAAPSVNLPIAQSEILYADYAFIPGRQYTIDINYTRVVNSGSSNPRNTTLYILDDDFEVVFSESSSAAAGANVATIEFTATHNCTKVGISHSSGADVTITINSHSAIISTFTDYSLRILNEDGDTIESLEMSNSELAANGFLHSVSFTSLDYDICNQRIRLEIWSEGSPEARVARTDLLDIQETQPGTKIISYTNETNFAGLYYENMSPDLVFYIRVRCRFFHEQMPQTDEAMELTSSVITTSSQKKNQKLLEVEHAPYYFHNKIIEVIQHHTLTIDNNTWKKEDEYAINQGTKNWPLKTATCFLTRTNSIVRNVI